MISRLDSDVGRLMEKLRADGLDRRTVVFFSSDNGPHREGATIPKFFDDNGPLRGTKRDLYEGGIRVPLIVRWPGHAPKGVVCDHVGYFGDFFATAAAIAGAACPPGLDSVSFAPLDHGRRRAPGRTCLSLLGVLRRGDRSRPSAIGRLEGRDPTRSARKSVELYDLRTDLGETTRRRRAGIRMSSNKFLAIAREAHVPSSFWPVPKAAGAAKVRPQRLVTCNSILLFDPPPCGRPRWRRRFSFRQRRARPIGRDGSRRPNILFLLTDDQRADAIHALGNHVIQTPNLDRLARSGLCSAIPTAWAAT